MSMYMDWGFFFVGGMSYSLMALKEGGEEESELTGDTYKKCMLSGIPANALMIDIFRKAPDWSLSYYTDHRRIPRPIALLFSMLYPAWFTFGFILAPRLEKARKGLGTAVMLAVGGLDSIYFMSHRKRLSFVGTLEEYENGDGKLILFHPIAWRYAVLGALLALQYIWVRGGLKKNA